LYKYFQQVPHFNIVFGLVYFIVICVNIHVRICFSFLLLLWISSCNFLVWQRAWVLHSRSRVRVRAYTSCKSLGQPGFYSLTWAHKVRFPGGGVSSNKKKCYVLVINLFKNTRSMFCRLACHDMFSYHIFNLKNS